MSDDSFVARLRQAIGHKSVRSFAEEAQITHAAIRQYLSGRSEPTRATIVKMAKAAGVSVGWLANGEASSVDMDFLPLYDAHVEELGGPLVHVTAKEKEKDFMAFKKPWVTSHFGVAPSDLCVVKVTGDGMSPTFLSEDLILVDLKEKKVSDEGIYVVILGERLFVKRFQWLAGGSLEMSSDNPRLKPISWTEKEVADLQILGRVIWAGHPVR